MSILLTNIRKWYGKRQIISNLSLEITEGEMFVLLGGSGSGKSTLLRIIAGLENADEGEIVIGGKKVDQLPPQDRDIGFVFQNYSVFRHMTIAQNIEFGLKIRGIPAAERKRKSTALMELVNLTGLGDRYTHQLSGGQQQRVALARALAYNPKVLLLDEPFGALDIKTRTQLRKSLRNIQHQLKTTTILVTHDQEEAFELADRIGVIDYGQLLEVGTPEALYHHPEKEFTANFVGSGNVLVGRKTGDTIALGCTRLPITPKAIKYDEKVPLRILFRPETVIVQRVPFKADQEIYVLGAGLIRELIFSGPLQRILIEVHALKGAQSLIPQPGFGQESVTIAASLPGTAHARAHFKPGEEVWVGLKDYHILDPGGLRILVHTDGTEEGNTAAQAGLTLGKNTGGSVTVLALTDEGNMPAMQENMEMLNSLWRPQLVGLNTKVSAGSGQDLLNEAGRQHYEVCVLHKKARGLRPATWHHLIDLGLPILLVERNIYKIQNILISIAAGEPGKDDILFGGRIAKLSGAAITILHLTGDNTGDDELERVNRFMTSGKLTLDALGIENNIKIKTSHDPVEGIILEGKQGNYDLLIIGAPAPKPAEKLIWPNKTLQIIKKTSCPVLVVPMVLE